MLLLACACPSFDEMEVTDLSGVASDDELSKVRATIDAFAAATGREGVCVPEVEIRTTGLGRLEGEISGAYRGRHDAIWVEQGSDLATITRHELCHALDEVEGLADPELFPPESVERDQDYRTDAERTGEAFARACDADPAATSIEATLLQACGLEEVSVVETWLLDTVYTGIQGAVPRVPVHIERHFVTGLPEGDMVRLSSAAVGLSAVRTDDFATYLGDPVVWTADTDGQVSVVTELPIDDTDADARWSLLPGDDRLLIVEAREEHEGWSLGLDSGALASVALPPLAPFAELYGVLEGDTLWFTDIAAEEPAFAVVDLATGRADEISWPVSGRVTATGWSLAGDHLLGVSGAHGLLDYDRAAESWEVRDAASLPISGIARDADRWLVTAFYVRRDGAEYVRTLLLYDRETDQWALPEDPCGVAAVEYPNPLQRGDEAWVWESTNQGGLYVSRVWIDR